MLSRGSYSVLSTALVLLLELSSITSTNCFSGSPYKYIHAMPQHYTDGKTDPVQPSPAGLTLEEPCAGKTRLGQKGKILNMLRWTGKFPQALVECGDSPPAGRPTVSGKSHFGDFGNVYSKANCPIRQCNLSPLLPDRRTVDGGWSEQAHRDRCPKSEGGIVV